MAPVPALTQAVALLRNYYLENGFDLSDLRFKITIAANGYFEMRRVNDDGQNFDARVESGTATIDDPAACPTGIYYLRPDEHGKFHHEPRSHQQRIADLYAAWLSLPPEEMRALLDQMNATQIKQEVFAGEDSDSAVEEKTN